MVSGRHHDNSEGRGDTRPGLRDEVQSQRPQVLSKRRGKQRARAVFYTSGQS